MKLDFRVLFLVVILFVCAANAFAQPPIAKALRSAIIPGWGELSMGDNSGYIFLASGVALWGSRLYFQQESDLMMRQSRQFAFNRANLKCYDSVNDQVWLLMQRFDRSGFEVGGYMESVVAEAMERFPHNPQRQTEFIRERQEQLGEDAYWDWGSRGTRGEFRRMIRDSAHFDDYALAVGGVIIVNHIVSFLNAIRIANSQNANNNIHIYTNVDRDMTRWVNWNVRF